MPTDSRAQTDRASELDRWHDAEDYALKQSHMAGARLAPLCEPEMIEEYQLAA